MFMITYISNLRTCFLKQCPCALSIDIERSVSERQLQSPTQVKSKQFKQTPEQQFVSRKPLYGFDVKVSDFETLADVLCLRICYLHQLTIIISTVQ